MLISHRLMVVNSLVVAAALAAQPTPRKEPLFKKLLRIAGLTAAPSQLKGSGEETEPGNIWIATIGGSAPRAVTRDGGYRSPVFGADGSVYALKGDMIARIAPDGGQSVPVQKVTGAEKLVGFDVESRDEIVVLLESPASGSPLAAISLKSGGRTPLPYDTQSEQERQMLAQIRGQDRVYGETKVYTRTETKSGLARPVEWTDVYVRRGAGEPRNVSACDGLNCSQPALSPDGRSVAFVKSGE